MTQLSRHHITPHLTVIPQFARDLDIAHVQPSSMYIMRLLDPHQRVLPTVRADHLP